MTTEEKLQICNSFLELVNRGSGERVDRDHQESSDKTFEGAYKVKLARRQAEEEVAAETEKAKRDVNDDYSVISFISDESCPVKIWN